MSKDTHQDQENSGGIPTPLCGRSQAFASLGQAELAGRLFKMLNPISHSDQYEKANRWREPYVVAADIYSRTPVAAGPGIQARQDGCTAWD
jgi:cellobiose phosphorylase